MKSFLEFDTIVFLGLNCLFEINYRVGGQGDLEVVLGSLTGAGVFVTTVVLGAVMLVTAPGKLKVSRNSMRRDVLAYLVTVLVIISVAWDDKITVFDAIGLLLVYVSYVTAVVTLSVTNKDGQGENEGGDNENGTANGDDAGGEAEEGDDDNGGPTPLAGLVWPKGEGGTMLLIERVQVRRLCDSPCISSSISSVAP